jgi:Tfp pilus assembly protein PilX
MMRARRTRPARAAQSGAVLMIGMVMLLMVTLVAVGVIRLSTRHTQVVNNEQVRTEATAAANYALDMLILNEPLTTWSGYAGTTGTTTFVNLGTTQTADTTAASVSVKVSDLRCKRGRVIKNSELIRTSGSGATAVKYVAAADSSCFGSGANQNPTIYDPSAMGAPTDDSLCATVLYEVQAQTTDAKLLNAKATVVQGVEVRTDVTALASSCS